MSCAVCKKCSISRRKLLLFSLSCVFFTYFSTFCCMKLITSLCVLLICMPSCSSDVFWCCVNGIERYLQLYYLDVFYVVWFLLFQVGELTPNGFQDVASLSSRASFCTIFLKNCGRGKVLWMTCNSGWG